MPSRDLVTRLLFGLLLCVSALSPQVSAASPDSSTGVLILAHGGSPDWNRTVTELVTAAQLSYPSEIAFGMGMHPPEVDGMQHAVDRLQAQGVSRIIVMPLLISSSSEVMDQFAYLFGLQAHGPWEDHTKPLTLRVPVTLQHPLDDDPVMGEVLLARAQALSQQPSNESVVLIAHGPVSDLHDQHWLATMENIATWIQHQGQFKSVVPMTLRDDAAPEVRDTAVTRMRDVVSTLGKEGDVLVIPVLLSKGGIEQKIPQALEGLTYRYSGETLLPHPAFSSWLHGRIDAAAHQDQRETEWRP